ncbi:GntR family transcriptional regulator [Brevibacterium album]|uniref:GntR family transcriptional regulator n=1 Tax=Brevibacterium album TaxID=417948 RepID=UPI00054FDC15|nr:GntR family transcriptional regulator [Brevibacterium album]
MGESESLAARAYRVLRDRLVMLDIAPGEPISEALLADEIGVGRTPLREALKRLEADHLVVTYPRRGTFAASVDLTDLAEITSIREALFPLAARSAAAGRGGSVAEALAEAVAEVVAEVEGTGSAGAGSAGTGSAGAGSVGAGAPVPEGRPAPDDGAEGRRALMELDVRVHRVITAAADSPHLEEILVRLDGLVTRLWCLMIDRLPVMREHIREHLPLMRAILAGDEDEAERLAREHVRHFDTEVRAVL